MSTTLGQAYVQIMPSAKGISGSIQKAINPEAVAAGKSAGKSIAESIAQSMERLGTNMKQVGKKLTTNLTLPIAGVGIAATKIGSSFESSMSKVAAISGATGSDLEKLTKKAREMGATTIFSASESADALNYMALAGWGTHEMLDGISGVMDLAAASGEDLALVSDIVTDGLSAFGLQAKEASRMADVLAAASANSNTNVDMLGQAFAYVAPVAGALGFTIEDTSKAIGLMSNAGIKSTKAGTALRAMMTNLAKPTESMHKAMQELGISLTDSQGNMKSFDDIMRDLRKSFANLSEDQQASAAATLFGKEAMSGALAIINASSDDFEKLGHAINNSEGAANNMAKTMQDNLQGRFKEMQSVLEDVAITVYDNIKPALEVIIDNISKAAKWFGDLSPKMQSTIVAIVGLVGVLGPVIIFFGSIVKSVSTLLSVIPKLIGFVKGLAGIFTALKTVAGVLAGALGAISAPIWITIGAVTALIAAGVALWKNWDKVKEFASKLWKNLKDGFTNIKNTIVEFFTVTIPEAFNNFLEKIKNIFESVKETIINFFTVIIPEQFNKFVTFISELPGRVMEFLNKLFMEDIPYAIGYAMGFLVRTASENIEKFINFFKELPGRIKEFFSNVIKNIIEFATEMKDRAIEAGKEFLDNIIDFFKQMPGRVKEFLTNTIVNVSTWAIDMRNKALEVGRNFVDSVIDFFRQLPGRVKDWLSKVITNIVTFGSNVKKKAFESGKKIYDGIVDAVKDLPKRMLQLGKDIIAGVTNGIKNTVSNVVGAAKDMAGRFLGGFKNALGIKSPSRVMMEMAHHIMSGLGLGLEKDGKNILSQTKDFVSDLAGSFSEKINLNLAADLGSAAYSVNDIVAVTSSVSRPASIASNDTNNTSAQIVIENMNVRDDQDIYKISRELQRIIDQNKRGRGFR